MKLTYPEALAAFESTVEHHVAVNNGVHIHYAATGLGPLIVFIHGFPDHWLTGGNRWPRSLTRTV